MAGKVTSVEAYFARVPEDRREALATLRELIRKTVPHARETLRYGMPTWELDGRDEHLCALASQKHYMSLYVCETGQLDAFRDAFAHLDVGKSCIRFKRLDQLPLAQVEKLLRASARG